MSQTNRHPVDALADVRAEIKKLQAQEETLRQTLIATNEPRIAGEENYAQIQNVTRKTLDREALEERFGKDAVAECCKSNTAITVYVKPLEH